MSALEFIRFFRACFHGLLRASAKAWRTHAPFPGLASAMLVLLGLPSCKEEPFQVMLDEVPYIEVRAAQPATVRALTDSVVLSVYYTDSDGDLGFAEADSAVVYVTDPRFPLTETFHVPPMAPEGTVVPITGVWEVVLERLILADPDASAEAVQLGVQIRDRAGHWSNEAQAPPITVVQP